MKSFQIIPKNNEIHRITVTADMIKLGFNTICDNFPILRYSKTGFSLEFNQGSYEDGGNSWDYMINLILDGNPQIKYDDKILNIKDIAKTTNYWLSVCMVEKCISLRMFYSFFMYEFH